MSNGNRRKLESIFKRLNICFLTEKLVGDGGDYWACADITSQFWLGVIVDAMLMPTVCLLLFSYKIC